MLSKIVLAVVAFAIPLPNVQHTAPIYIKDANHQSFRVPDGTSPEDYKQQLMRMGQFESIDSYSRYITNKPLANAHTRPYITSTSNVYENSDSYQPKLHYPMTPQVGVYDGIVGTATGGFIDVGRTGSYGNQTLGHQSYIDSYPGRAHAYSPSYGLPHSSYNDNHDGQRRWVKIREGTEPIEVPLGLNPQTYLDGVRNARNYN